MMVKRYFFLSLFVLFMFSLEATGQRMINYTNEEDGYYFQYPETWKRSDDFESQLSLVALAPEETEAEDGVRESLNLAVFKSEKTSPAIFYENYRTSHKEKHRSWKLIGEGELKARETNALFFTCYYADMESGRTRGEVVYVFQKGTKVIVLTCTSSFDEFDKYKILFDKMAGSFSFDVRPDGAPE